MRRFFLTALSLLCLLSVTTGCREKPEGSVSTSVESGHAKALGNTIEGTIYLSKPLKAEPGNVLYIIARRDSEGGMPTAVQRIENPNFPIAYSLSEKDSMLPESEPFDNTVLVIKARLSRSGDATAHPGDIEGFHPYTVPPGTKGVDIVLAQVR
ncbi:MAG: hypothetical protein AB1405_15280 [Bdellovibrionota bacterium]